MSISKALLPSEGSPKSITSLLGFAALTVSSANAYKHGVVTVLEFNMSDSSTKFVKVGNNGQLEVGGTLEMGTGTKVSW
ncbi:MAG: hypothetical protein KGL39_50740 [Patescibacteria group bacterium]|nr:hypothetical protein [Patescibacteria group bacterium]